jgi:hypothetical protein
MAARVSSCWWCGQRRRTTEPAFLSPLALCVGCVVVVAGVVFAGIAWSASHPIPYYTAEDNDGSADFVLALGLAVVAAPAAFVVAVAVLRRALWTVTKAVWIAVAVVVAIDALVMADYWRLLVDTANSHSN